MNAEVFTLVTYISFSKRLPFFPITNLPQPHLFPYNLFLFHILSMFCCQRNTQNAQNHFSRLLRFSLITLLKFRK